MLLSFRFANHRSFRDEQQLNLTPVYETDDAPADTIDQEAIPVAGIFGANASGKSNVISAFSYFQTMVQRPDRDSEPGVGLPRSPFRLELEVARASSSYALDLALDGVRYTYGL
jgi:AAA15 family ATPase/GTPase